MKRRTVTDVIRAASTITGFRTHEIAAAKRTTHDIYDVRLAVSVVAHVYLGKSFKAIGRSLHKHHTSIMAHMVSHHRDRAEIKRLVQQIVEHLERPSLIELLLEQQAPHA